MLHKIGKGVFSKINNQLTESEKDKLEFCWKHFRLADKQSTENNAIKAYLKMLVVKIYRKKWNTSRTKKKLSTGMYMEVLEKEQSNICPIFGLFKDKLFWSSLGTERSNK